MESLKSYEVSHSLPWKIYSLQQKRMIRLHLNWRKYLLY
jgi:hypothetical protein